MSEEGQRLRRYARLRCRVPMNATKEQQRTFEAGYQSMQQRFKGTLDHQPYEYLAKAAQLNLHHYGA
jgi:hypothetical protein